MSGKELVSSASDLADQFLAAARKEIEQGQIEIAKLKREEQIIAHYYSTAKNLYEQIWKECKKKTSHVAVSATNSEGRVTGYLICKHCGMPIQSSETDASYQGRKTRGITALANKLRAADKAAEVEWIPK